MTKDKTIQELIDALKALLFEIERVQRYSRFKDADTLRVAAIANMLFDKLRRAEP